ncbi:MAG TPA: MazG family protein [Acidimicrobiales bacterium]|nr:MazG family protein [Acidimicrobiales bacterium]
MRPTVVVVGLGPAGPDLLTTATVEALASVPHRYLRTTRHPAAVAVDGAASFDPVYQSAATLEEVYAGIVDALAEAAAEHGTVLYAVPGSPLIAERTVELLREDGRVDLEVVPALSFLDLAWAELGVDPVAEGVRVVDGRRFSVEAAGERGPLLVAQCDSRQVLSDIKLTADDRFFSRLSADGGDVTVLQRLGLPDQSVTTVAWADLDKEVEPDHLTSIWLPAAAPPVAREVARFDQLVRTLRERCPWDREQTHRTLTRHLLEETYEVLEAIAALPDDVDDLDAGEGFDHLEEELGDLLFQVVFHATLAAEEGWFTLADVARGVHDKLVHRHPHVFAGVTAETPDQVVTNWEQIKRAEKGRTSLMDGIAEDLPSLLYAHKVQRKAASAGLEPVAPGDGLGAELFALVDRCRRAEVDPEAALRSTATRFRARFQAAEALASERGVDIAEVWDQA